MENFIMIIGVTGNIGSGKSTIAKLIANEIENSTLVDADSIARQIINNDVYSIERHIGVSKSNWIYDKKALSFLEHYVTLNLIPAINTLEAQYIVVFDAPLLVEMNLHKWCDIVIIVDAPYDVRLNRVKLRDNRSEKEFELLNSMQYSIETKLSIVKNPIVFENTQGIVFANALSNEYFSIVERANAISLLRRALQSYNGIILK